MRVSSIRYVAITLAVVLLVLGVALPASAASSRTRVPFGAPRILSTRIACFSRATHRFILEVSPSRCEIAGRDDREELRFPVSGITWHKWGQFRSLGSDGADNRIGIHLRLIAYRRVRCGDGRVFYSRVNAMNLRNGFIYRFHLSTCGISEGG